MNFALVAMSSAWIAGGDPAGCIDCVVPTASVCDPCVAPASPSLLARLKARLPGADGVCCLPSNGLIAKLKAKLQMPEPATYPCSVATLAAAPCAQPASLTTIGSTILGSCSLPPLPGANSVAATTPKEMPKPEAPGKDVPKAMPRPAAEPFKDGRS